MNGPKDTRRNRQRPERVSLRMWSDQVDAVDAAARRLGITRYALLNAILGEPHESLSAPLANRPAPTGSQGSGEPITRLSANGGAS